MSCTVYYFFDKEETAYSITIHKRPEFVTLGDFRRALGFHGSFVFHFQAFIEGFGKAKLRMSEDTEPVPFDNGRAICWLESCVDESLLCAETTAMTTTANSGVGARFLHVTYIVVDIELHLADFLGIQVAGQGERRAVGGVFVHLVEPGSAAYRDGRIEAGDSLLRINNISLENLTNEQAVRLLREVAARHSRIRLVVGKMSLPQETTVDETASFRVTPATQRRAPRIGETISIMSDSESLSEPSSAMAELNLTAETDYETILHALMSPDSGLDVRDRSWLKMTIRRAFTGADLVAWLFMHVEGFVQRRDACKFADVLLKHGYIVQPGRRVQFSENCYYVFGQPTSSATMSASSFGKTVEEDEDEYSDSDSGSYNCGTGMGSTIEHVMDSFSTAAPKMRVWSTTSSGSLSSTETFLTGSTSNNQGGSQRRDELSSPCQLYFPPLPLSSARLARLNNTAANTTLSQTLSSLYSTPGVSFFN